MKEVQGSKKVFMVLTEPLLARIDKQAAKNTMSRSLLVRLACEKFLKELEAGGEVVSAQG
jgi:metal-responsive CopG/Arc/MetJ family transcriptional regulator